MLSTSSRVASSRYSVHRSSDRVSATRTVVWVFEASIQGPLPSLGRTPSSSIGGSPSADCGLNLPRSIRFTDAYSAGTITVDGRRDDRVQGQLQVGFLDA